ncbi:MAG: response regulator [Candidatus Obscuribacterales bacterium]|nr:response regulator [Candidatus Obscuribacterales bacterium]
MAKILLVEDDHVLANTLLDWLEFKGHETEHVDTGNKALEKIFAPVYDIIVLDWNLPDLTGIEICKKYRQDGGVLPVLMLTGRHGSSEEAQCKAAGATKYLAKPFQLEDLTRELDALLTVDV